MREKPQRPHPDECRGGPERWGVAEHRQQLWPVEEVLKASEPLPDRNAVVIESQSSDRDRHPGNDRKKRERHGLEPPRRSEGDHARERSEDDGHPLSGRMERQVMLEEHIDGKTKKPQSERGNQPALDPQCQAG